MDVRQNDDHNVDLMLTYIFYCRSQVGQLRDHSGSSGGVPSPRLLRRAPCPLRGPHLGGVWRQGATYC